MTTTETTPAGRLDHAKIKDYLEHFTAEREEAWAELNRAQQRFDALTKTVAGLQQILASLSSGEAENDSAADLGPEA